MALPRLFGRRTQAVSARVLLLMIIILLDLITASTLADSCRWSRHPAGVIGVLTLDSIDYKNN